MLRGLDLFTGYGGLTLALKEWIKPIAYVEIEEYCQKIIAYRMAEGNLYRAPIYSDIKNVRALPGACDIIYGGFPCQDISVAGLRKGLEGKRSGLFFEIVRLTEEINPTFVFLENVPGIRTKGLRQVVGAFAEMGYDCRWTCLSASSVGANHQRDRWFFLAHNNSSNLWNEQGRSGWEDWQRENVFADNGEKESLAHSNKGRSDQDISLQTRDERESDEPKWNSQISDSESKGLERYDCKTRQSEIPEPWSKGWWETEPNVGRVVDGASSRLDFNKKYEPEEIMKYFCKERLQMLGNGVVPLQAKTAFEKLIGLK